MRGITLLAPSLRLPCLELPIDNSISPNVYCNRDRSGNGTIFLRLVYHYTQRKASTSRFGAFPYAEGRHLVKNTARTPAQYKLWAAAMASQDGRTHPVGAVSRTLTGNTMSCKEGRASLGTVAAALLPCLSAR